MPAPATATGRDDVAAVARATWAGLAGDPDGFRDGVTVLVAPGSALGPEGCLGLVSVAGAVLAGAPDERTAEVARSHLAGLTAAEATDPLAWTSVLDVRHVLGPARLAYLAGPPVGRGDTAGAVVAVERSGAEVVGAARLGSPRRGRGERAGQPHVAGLRPAQPRRPGARRQRLPPVAGRRRPPVRADDRRVPRPRARASGRRRGGRARPAGRTAAAVARPCGAVPPDRPVARLRRGRRPARPRPRRRRVRAVVAARSQGSWPTPGLPSSGWSSD